MVDYEKAAAAARKRFEASKVASQQILGQLDTLEHGFNRQSMMLSRIGTEALALQRDLAARRKRSWARMGAQSSPRPFRELSPRRGFAENDRHFLDASISDVAAHSEMTCCALEQVADVERKFGEPSSIPTKSLIAENAVLTETISLLESRCQIDVEAARRDTERPLSDHLERLKVECEEFKLRDKAILDAESQLANDAAVTHECLRAENAKLVSNLDLMESQCRSVVEAACLEAEAPLAEQIAHLKAECRELMDSAVVVKAENTELVAHVGLLEVRLNTEVEMADQIEQLRCECKELQEKAAVDVELAMTNAAASEDEMLRAENAELMNRVRHLEFQKESAVEAAVESAYLDIEGREAGQIRWLTRECREARDQLSEAHMELSKEEELRQASELQLASLRSNFQAELLANSHAAATQKSEYQVEMDVHEIHFKEALQRSENEVDLMRARCKILEDNARLEARSEIEAQVAKIKEASDMETERRAEESRMEMTQIKKQSMATQTGQPQVPTHSDKRESGFASGSTEPSLFCTSADDQVTREFRENITIPTRLPSKPKFVKSLSVRFDVMENQTISPKEVGLLSEDEDRLKSVISDNDRRSRVTSVAESEVWEDSTAHFHCGPSTDDSSPISLEDDHDTDQHVAREKRGSRLRSSSDPMLWSRSAPTLITISSFIDTEEPQPDQSSFARQRLNIPSPKDTRSVSRLHVSPRRSKSTQFLSSSSLSRCRGDSRSDLDASPRGRERRSTQSRSPVSRYATSEEYGQCLADGILEVLRLPFDDHLATSVPLEAFKDVRELNLIAEVENNKVEFQFDAVAPEVFRDLRRNAFGVEDEEFANSISLHPLTGGRQGEGKSGMLFFFSWDKRYIAKTTDSVEVPFFFDGLHHYHNYLRGNDASFLPGGGGGHTSSFLPRYSGFYGLKIRGDYKTYLVVFENIFPPGVTLKEKYDLKGVLGSKRFVSEEERRKGIEVLKDRNFLSRSLNVGQAMKERLTSQLRKDVGFLEERGRIDYSLLLGVASIDAVKQPPHSDASLNWPTIHCRGVPSLRWGDLPGDEVFFLGIIDILQEYTSKKAVENTFKSFKHGLTHLLKTSSHADSNNAVSAVPPPQYAKRFFDFITSKMI